MKMLQIDNNALALLIACLSVVLFGFNSLMAHSGGFTMPYAMVLLLVYQLRNPQWLCILAISYSALTFLHWGASSEHDNEWNAPYHLALGLIAIWSVCLAGLVWMKGVNRQQHPVTTPTNSSTKKDPSVERRLSVTEDTLRLATDAAQIGIWQWDRERDSFVLSELCMALLGWDNKIGLGLEQISNALHPEDRQPLFDAIGGALKHQEVYEVECRVVWPDGTTRWVLVAGSGAYDYEGRISHMEGIVLDIDDRRSSERIIQEANQRMLDEAARMQLVFDSAVDGMVIINSKGVVKAFNPAAEEIFGFKAEEILGQKVKTLMPEPYSSEYEVHLTQYSQNGERKNLNVRREIAGKRKNGATFPMGISIGEVEIDGERQFTAILRDISDRKAAQAALEQAKLDAEAANLAKSTFLANMSHELRTPLNSIIGYSELLLEESNDLQRENIGPDLLRIGHAGRHLLSLINNILELAKAEAGKITLSPEEFQLCEFIETVSAIMKPLAKADGSIFEINCSESTGAMRTDRTILSQILTNLLSNAMKFTRAGKITLTVSRESGINGDSVIFEVQDTGIGMDTDQLSHVFEAFTQADSTATRRYGGTGLGLAIAKQYTELLRGLLTCESIPGVGSTFVLHLPVDYQEPCLIDKTKQINHQLVA